jgi:SAM-dependent methyltransferase
MIRCVSRTISEVSTAAESGLSAESGMTRIPMERPSYPDLPALWRNRGALERAREAALGVARERLARRRRESAGSSAQVIEAHHLGYDHLHVFRSQLLPLVSELPPEFRALEIGAGMGWHATLLAAHGAGRVLATEIEWGGDTPFGLANVHALHRIAQEDDALARSVHFTRDSEGHLVSVSLPPGLGFVRAPAEHLPLPSGSVDFLYSVNCLEHLPDPAGAFDEAARVLRIGGTCFMTSRPLFYSAEGHHLDDIFPVPWGHLLWEPEALAELVVREAGQGRDWEPGVPLRPEHLVTILRGELNYASPTDLRGVLRRGPWRLNGWVDVTADSDKELEKTIGLREALRGVPAEALFLRGVAFRLTRRPAAEGLQMPFRFSHIFRRRVRKVMGPPRTDTADD